MIIRYMIIYLKAWNDEGYVAINFPPLFEAAAAAASPAFVK